MLTDLSPSALAGAVKSNLYALFQSLRFSSAATFSEDADFLRWNTVIPHPWFNGVLSRRAAAEDSSRVVGEMIDYFQARGVTSFTWWLAPQLDPAAWSGVLLPRGFQYDDSTPGMAMDLADLPAPGQLPLVVQTVTNGQELSEWAHTFNRGYELPGDAAAPFLAFITSLGIDLPFRNYLGYLDGRPVATATLFLGAGAAGIYNVATLPEARGRGLGSAMTLVPLGEARAMGYRVGVLQSSEMGYRLYQRIGFQKSCQMDHFFWQAGPG